MILDDEYNQSDSLSDRNSTTKNSNLGDSIEINFQELINEKEKLPPPVINPEKDPYSGINLFNNLLDSNYAYATFDRSGSLNTNNENNRTTASEIKGHEDDMRKIIEPKSDNCVQRHTSKLVTQKSDLDDVDCIEVNTNIVNSTEQEYLWSPLDKKNSEKSNKSLDTSKIEQEESSGQAQSKFKNPYKWIMEEFENKSLDKVKRTLLVTLDDISKGNNRRSRSVSVTRTPYYSNNIPHQPNQIRQSRKIHDDKVSKVSNSESKVNDPNISDKNDTQPNDSTSDEENMYLKTVESNMNQVHIDSLKMSNEETDKLSQSCPVRRNERGPFNHLKQNEKLLKSLNEKKNWHQNRLEHSKINSLIPNYSRTFDSCATKKDKNKTLKITRLELFNQQDNESSNQISQQKQKYSTATITKRKNQSRHAPNILPQENIDPEENFHEFTESHNSNDKNLDNQKYYEDFTDVQVIAKMQEESLRQSMRNISKVGVPANINLISEFYKNSSGSVGRRLNESLSASKIFNKPKTPVITKSSTMFNYNTNQQVFNYDSSNINSSGSSQRSSIFHNSSSRSSTPSKVLNTSSNKLYNQLDDGSIKQPQMQTGRRPVLAYGGQRSATTSIVPMIGGKSVFSTAPAPPTSNQKTSWQKKKLNKITKDQIQQQRLLVGLPKSANTFSNFPGQQFEDQTSIGNISSSGLISNSSSLQQIESNQLSRYASPGSKKRVLQLSRVEKSGSPGSFKNDDLLQQMSNQQTGSNSNLHTIKEMGNNPGATMGNKITNQQAIRKSFLPQPVQAQNRQASISPIRYGSEMHNQAQMSSNWKDGCY